jgi:uncharacterized membrane protein YoaT (DUF817 family)
MVREFCREFFTFGVKQARACVFAGTFFVILLASRYLPLFGLYRYDFICVAAIVLQLALLLARVESKDEFLTLCAFHVLGLILELFKTHPLIARWSYPEAAYLKVGWVPLYSGFMYAAVASYMCQAWRVLRLELTDYPSYRVSVPLSAAIYLNFFTHHFIWDFRWPLVAAVFVVFWRTRVHFTVIEKRRRMPLILSFALIGLFIWIAENISTYLGAWVYPNQQAAWQVVSSGKITSWFLMVIVSFLIVADLKHMRERRLVLPPLPEAPRPAGRRMEAGYRPPTAFTRPHHVAPPP